MDQELQKLIQRVNEAEAKASQEQRRREEADAKAAGEQRLREEEQRLREEAEAGSEHSKPQNLLKYLANCHQYFHTPTVITDKSSTTQGYTTDPTNR